MGLNSAGVPAEERAITIADYAEKVVDLINNRSRSIGKSFLYYFIPKYDDLTQFVETVRGHLSGLKEEDAFARKKVTQLIENIELYNKSRALLKN
jgi:acetoacetate decarboxylase